MKQQVALVTGASSGFGKLIAEKLVEAGYTVYGTSRKALPDITSGVKMRQLDVTDDESIDQCIQSIIHEHGRIDVLINNAGVLHVSLIEETSRNTIDSVMDTNFMGVVRVTEAVLPHMRRQRSGKIINISSLAGLIAPPGEGYYAASKYALEGYSEALSFEVMRFGIHVVLVEPSYFKTEMANNIDTSNSGTISDYDSFRDNVVHRSKTGVLQGDDPAKVASLIVRIVQKERPRLRYRIGIHAIWIPRLRKLMPQWIFRIAMAYAFGILSSR